MFWTGFFIGFAACLAIGLIAHFVHNRRQRAAFISIFRQRSAKNSKALRVLGAIGTTSETCCITSSSR